MEELSATDNDQSMDHDSPTNKILERLSLATDYISMPLCFAAVAINLLLIFVILNHKRLRRRRNYYLLNFAIFHSIYIISTPFLHLMVDTIYGGYIQMKWYCVWLRVENYAIIILVTFAGGYSLDAFLEKRNDKWFNLYEKYYLRLFALLHILGLVLYAVAATLCLLRDNEIFNFYFLTTLFLIISIMLLYAVWINKKRKIFDENTNALKVSLTVVTCFSPMIFCYNLLHIFKDNHNIEVVIWYLAFLPEFLAYCCSMILVYKIYNSDKHFKVAFRRVFRRPVPDADYDELNAADDVEVK